MARRFVVGTGWKMNLLARDVPPYAARLGERLRAMPPADIDMFVLPPFTSLHAARVAFAGSPVRLGAQNMHWEASGAWTGEISAAMLVEAGCTYVALGHSERLAYFAETYDLVRRKASAALRAGLTPILCVGESSDERQAGVADIALERQVGCVLEGCEHIADVVIAYEPRWAIGQQQAASVAYVADRHGALRRFAASRYGDAVAQRLRIIYGGSVTPANGAELIAGGADVDGLFIGRAAWTADGFAEMIAIVSAAATSASDRLQQGRAEHGGAGSDPHSG
ncbi:triose-phosphate isomerase [Lichenicoccus sp.]|uniref:triose-phosphate isomerase n=1 Tax=Lichenicoccus sp. TaxID=2781899 RepID=UPI003D0B720C